MATSKITSSASTRVVNRSPVLGPHVIVAVRLKGGNVVAGVHECYSELREKTTLQNDSLLAASDIKQARACMTAWHLLPFLLSPCLLIANAARSFPALVLPYLHYSRSEPRFSTISYR
jgi:hypothetical protein